MLVGEGGDNTESNGIERVVEGKQLLTMFTIWSDVTRPARSNMVYVLFISRLKSG